MIDTPGAAVDETVEPGGRGRARRWWIVLGVGAVVVVLGVALVAWIGIVDYHAREDRPLPAFPSLAAHPDPAVHGTVAYFDDATRCVRLVPAGGGASKQLWCLPAEDPSTWPQIGKPVGPQLVWRPDGRLEVTMFRMKPTKTATSAPPLAAGWQKLVDVRTGAVEDVAASEVPAQPNTTTQPVVNQQGQRITTDFDGSTGKATVKVSRDTGTRTVLSVHGPGAYMYRFGPVFWAPDGTWIAATDDGRILVVRPDDPPVTGVLVTGSGGGAGGGTAGPTFAVTSADLLSST